MRINKVIIRNFRIYKGLIEVSLNINDLKKNISIIAGYNGFGKTTFLNALVWCLYGKLIAEVDEKYRREIYEVGGYKKYSYINLNREIRNSPKAQKEYSVEVELSEIVIPTVPCNKISIQRTYNLEYESEKTTVLIDGFENELTKEVGSDIFINDFILPKEIAKFFFFDAEKIVSLSEIRTIGEKKGLSRAYSEVLGISKYENLKRNLENLRIKLRKRSANLDDRIKLDLLQKEGKEINRLITYNRERISEIKAEIDQNRVLSEQYQEKLIREGNHITVEELIALKKLRDKLNENNLEIKSRLKELLELVPFAIAGSKTKELYAQIQYETRNKQRTVDREFLTEKLGIIKDKLFLRLEEQDFHKPLIDEVKRLISESFKPELLHKKEKREKVLLDLSEEEMNEFNTLFENLKHTFNILFKQIIKEERNNRTFLAKTVRKISHAESKESDILSKKYKSEKEKIDKKIQDLNSELNQRFEDLGALQQQLATKYKLVSELSKTVRLDEIDSEKDIVAERLIKELNDFLFQFKQDKKASLESRIKKELDLLMHKESFISDVEVEISDEIIEIHLFGRNEELIEKETLSKGEQQLYATALLKALVEESEIKFPIFIDSPLQKFDKKHSNNIIREFYPSISKQVIIFPLLEKELTEKEYELLLPNINQVFLIRNKGDSSTILEKNPNELFNQSDLKSNVYPHKDIEN